MAISMKKLCTTLLTAVLAAPYSSAVMADDAEIFISRPADVGARPNVLFILDTSGSMAGRDGGPGTPSRIEIVRDAAIELVKSLDGVNIGLMRYSSDAQGGMVLEAVDDIANNRQTMLDRLGTFNTNNVNGNTPLSETLYEASLYLQGKAIKYGNNSKPEHSVDASRTSAGSNTYKSPIDYQCQKSYVVYLTDGEPTSDNDANGDIGTMIGHACAPPSAGNNPPGNGQCTDDLAAWMANTSTDLSSSQTGNQNALTYMIGYGATVGAGSTYLNTVAAAGGTGAAYMAADAATLADSLEKIFADIDNRSQTFTTPSISVNAFNRTQTGTDLFFSLFRVEDTPHWNGNLKKYTLKGSAIVDANGAPAVTSGFFSAGSTSIWSATQDGANVTDGGAVSRLPDPPNTRNLYTWTGGTKDLTSGANALVDGNGALTNAMLNVPDAANRQAALNWARGYPNGDTANTPVKSMGDPVHGQAAIVTYGGTAADPDTVVFVPTNDGFLHAIKGTSNTAAGGGVEQWAFIPPELLPRLNTLRSITAGAHTYGLDGDIVVLKSDQNHNGIVDGSDYVWLIFGMRMGGTNYYALDVTDPTAPKLKWSVGAAQLPGVGYTWSTPVITKVDTTTNADPNKLVVIVGGGYDVDQDGPPPRTGTVVPYSADDVGNHVYMLDASTGALLWSAGPTGASTLQVPKMTNSIPSRVSVIDRDSDGFADRLYVGDMGGQIWRFDVFNGTSGAGLVTGGVIADLGAKASGANATTDNRRFYNAPDVALIQRRGADPYYNLAIGSGYRGHPLDTGTNERFYSIRDKSPFTKFTQLQYNSITPVVDASLPEVTSQTVLSTSPGWKFNISQRAGRGGEKILAEATTVNGVILFPSFQPGGATAQGACFPVNTNRVYALGVDSGKAALDFNDDGTNDLSTDLNQTGIVGQINVGILQQTGTDSDGDGIPDSEENGNTICLAGVEVLSKCVSAGGTVRTFWRRNVD